MQYLCELKEVDEDFLVIKHFYRISENMLFS